MKSFVIYLVVFFIIASIIRGQKHINSTKPSDFFHNPFLEKNGTVKKHFKEKNKLYKPAYIKSSPRKLDKPILKLDISSILTTQLQPIEQKYLQKSLKKHLFKRWYTKNPTFKQFKLAIEIDKKLISQRRYVKTIKGKRQYRLEEKFKIKIKYKVYNSSGKLILNGMIPYKVLVKSGSFWDYIECERLAKKELFMHIGKKIANILNRKYYYITQKF